MGGALWSGGWWLGPGGVAKIKVGKVELDQYAVNVFHEFKKAPLAPKSLSQGFFLEEGKNLSRDSATDEDATGRHGLEREVAGLCSEDGGKQLHRFEAERTRVVQCCPRYDHPRIVAFEGLCHRR